MHMKSGDRVTGTVSIDASKVATVRRTNLGLILQLLRDHGARSRSRIAAESGLPKATVSSLIAELVERGLVREGEADRSKGVGRPGQTVGLDGTAICALGLEIDADYIGVLALDLQGTEIHRDRVALDVRGQSPEAALGTVADVIREGLAAVQARGVRPVGICLATPGVVDAGEGTVVFAPNIGWRDVPVRAWLRERLGPGVLEVDVDNDARLSTVAEHAQFAHQHVTDLLLLTGESGVAGGVITNGRLLRGHAGLAGEIGHASLGPSDEPCPCGRTGCWETVVGLGALLRRVADAGDPVRDASRDLEERMADVMRRAQDGDERTLGALGDIAQSLAHGVSILADILNPQVIALGGYFAYFGDYFVPAVEERLESRMMLSVFPHIEVTRSRLGFSAAAYGAARFALGAVFQDPTRVDAPAGR
ncbi:ROK family transcriptional regulator [Streptomyces sp. 35G-GA-8]|uniref:ROK family transcriptional regulator n=1 Tax=Streptomyces sp. 35G-GA-8 TaxID=2939434 RepID=UPI00201EF571|nr:ROK family transcriptional regulator [Streptomyces sp. 35G-GA-8]MCL7380538.1 ROK family protein [Streptomyces sp. 35G-GA-8]